MGYSDATSTFGGVMITLMGFIASRGGATKIAMKHAITNSKGLSSAAPMLVAIIGLAIGIVPFFKAGMNQIQWLFMGVTIVFVGGFLYMHDRFGHLETNVLSAVGDDGLAPVQGHEEQLDELYSSHSSAIAFVDSSWYSIYATYCAKPDIARKTRWLFMGGAVPDGILAGAQVHLLNSPVLGLFFFDVHAASPQAGMLFTHANANLQSRCIKITDPALAAAMFASFETTYGSQATSLEDALDPAWLLQHIARARQRIDDDWRDLKALRITARSAAEIYVEQLALSRGATSIHAFDMTDIDQWSDQKHLGACLLANLRMARAAPDGPTRIRRVFLAPDRETLTSKPDYAKKLKDVLETHKTGGLGYGLVFQNELRMRRQAIKDFAVYGKRVVWVETEATTRYTGEGYFSTSKAEVGQYIKLFETVWTEDNPRTPAEDAGILLS